MYFVVLFLCFIKMFFCSDALFSQAPAEAEEAWKRGDLQKSIELYEAYIKESKTDREVWLRLALLHFQDQQVDRAYRAFLQSIDSLDHTSYTLSEEEQKSYEEGLELYLGAQQKDRREVAREIVRRWGKDIVDHPDWAQVGLLVAVARANMQKTAEFFSLAFSHLQKAPECYLSFRIRGILQLHLMDRALTEEERLDHKEKAESLVFEAWNRCKRDVELARILVHLDQNYVVQMAQYSIEKNQEIPRRDLFFYVKTLAKQGQLQLAQQVVDRAYVWYQYSRTLDQAKAFVQEQLEKQKNTVEKHS